MVQVSICDCSEFKGGLSYVRTQHIDMQVTNIATSNYNRIEYIEKVGFMYSLVSSCISKSQLKLKCVNILTCYNKINIIINFISLLPRGYRILHIATVP